MNELKQQIVYMRQAMFSKGMTRELEGFDTAIRLFADTKKKTFKQKLSEGWQKHKGKILAGAALAAAGGAGLWGYNQKKRADKAEMKALGLAMTNAVNSASNKATIASNKATIASLTKKLEATAAQLAKVTKEYNDSAKSSSADKDALIAQMAKLQSEVTRLTNQIAEYQNQKGSIYAGATTEQEKQLDDMKDAVNWAKQNGVGALPAGDKFN
jgi:chromosome segregation ATPase